MVLKVEAHLHWSEYVRGEWTTRQSSDFTAPSPLYMRLGDKGGNLATLELNSTFLKELGGGVAKMANVGLAGGIKGCLLYTSRCV